MGQERTRTLDDRTCASDPGRVRLSHDRLRRFHPELYRLEGLWSLLRRPSPDQRRTILHLEEHLFFGDSRAAIVVSTGPLLVAAYTDELDCIALLYFPKELAAEHELEVGSRLLTVNLYEYGRVPVADLQHGPASYQRYRNFFPLIADFLSEDRPRIEFRKLEIEESEWERATALAAEYLAKRGMIARDGRPLYSGEPAFIKLHPE